VAIFVRILDLGTITNPAYKYLIEGHSIHRL